jgi:hypothetical protein
MPPRGHPFFKLTIIGGMILGNLVLPGDGGTLPSPMPAQATSSAKKLQRKLAKAGKKSKKALKKAEKKAFQAEKAMLLGAVEVGSAVLAALAEGSWDVEIEFPIREEGTDRSPSSAGTRSQRPGSVHPVTSSLPPRGRAAPRLPVQTEHRTVSPKP